jgi:hypothetical protein
VNILGGSKKMVDKAHNAYDWYCISIIILYRTVPARLHNSTTRLVRCTAVRAQALYNRYSTVQYSREKHLRHTGREWPRSKTGALLFSGTGIRIKPLDLAMLMSFPRATAQGLSITSVLVLPSPKLLLPYHQQPERPLSPLSPFPRPSFSPPLLRPPLMPLHSMAYYTSSCIV